MHLKPLYLGINGIKTNSQIILFALRSVIQAWMGGKLKVAVRLLRTRSDAYAPHHRHQQHSHLRRPSTNAQRSWTTSIWGIILYEIDGWGQPLTERVKTTLRCPLWISMMENRLLKKIYVCSLLPQERSPTPPPHPLTPALTNQTCHCGQIKLTGSVLLPALRQLAHCHAKWQEAPFCFFSFIVCVCVGVGGGLKAFIHWCCLWFTSSKKKQPLDVNT